MDLGDLARPPRASLPEGNVILADGRVLHRAEYETERWNLAYRLHGAPGHGVIYRTIDTHPLTLIAAMEEHPRFGPLLHISMSYAHQNPRWKEIKLVKQAFYGPDRDVMLVLPREKDYVDVHPYCFHLWECPQAWGLQ